MTATRQKKTASQRRIARRTRHGDMREAKSHIIVAQRLSQNGLTSLCCTLSLLSISAAVNVKLDALTAGTDERTV